MIRSWTVAVAIVAAPMGAMAGGPPEPIDPGPTTAARIEIRNDSPETLTCRAVAARWFAFEFGELAPGMALGIDVAIGKANAAVMIVNKRGLPVPLETIYCGRPASLWATRSALDLSRVGAAGLSQAIVRVRCRDEAAAVVCGLAS